MKDILLNSENVTDQESLHLTIKEQCGLPEYYGMNLDALYDVLTDIKEDTNFIVDDFFEVQDQLGHYFNKFLQVLEDAATDNPYIKYTIEKKFE